MKKMLALLIAVMLLPIFSGCSQLLSSLRPARAFSPTPTPAGTGDMVSISKSEYERLKRFEKLSYMLDTMENNYYKEFDSADLLTGAAQGLLYGLKDPYTFYYTPQEYAEMWADDEGNYAGIGIQILTSTQTLMCTVSRVFKGSPALAAGVLKGDLLLQVEDILVDAYSLQDAVDIMRGKPGEPVTIKVQRREEILEFTINRAQIKVNWIEHTMLENNVGYILLYEFAGDCRVAFAQALKDLESKGAKSLIVDLRDNGGGWVDDAEAIADLFLDAGVLCYLQYRNGDKEYYTLKDGKTDIPLVLLVNAHSASSSEILAGALKDYGRATIVGENTFGKGVVQHVVYAGEDGSGMQFTAAQYFTPDGNQVHETGIAPDVEMLLPEEDLTKMFALGDMADVQLKTAYEVALGLIK
jgi:C-terminal peptidase (prc)